MNKFIVLGSVAALTAFSVCHHYQHTEITVPHEDEYREVYTKLNPEIQQMATGSLGADNRAEWTYLLP